jgi:hypothetical protein
MARERKVHHLVAESLTTAPPVIGGGPSKQTKTVHHLRTYGSSPGRPPRDENLLQQISATLEAWIRTRRPPPMQWQSHRHLEKQFPDVTQRTIRDIVKATHRNLGMRTRRPRQ